MNFLKWARKHDLKGWCFTLGTMAVVITVAVMVQCWINAQEEPSEPKMTMKTTEHSVATVFVEECAEVEEEYISLGEFTITAYCSCEECCGYWATVRPLDENGEPIVYTANESVAEQGVTVAADTSVLPFGTIVTIDGHEYEVQDTGSAAIGNHIDVYFEDHDEAKVHGIQYKEIFMKVV